MSISTISFHMPRWGTARQAAPAAPGAAAPRDGDKTDITLGQLVKGAVGIVPGALIDGVGLTASVVAHTPCAVAQSYRSLYYDNQHGPMLKTLIGALVPVAVGAGLIIATVGSVAYGIGMGAYDAATKGIGQSVHNRIEDVKNFNKTASESLKSWREDNDRLRDQQNQPPAPPPAPEPQPAP